MFYEIVHPIVLKDWQEHFGIRPSMRSMMQKFKLTRVMSQWDKNHKIYVVLPATTEGEIVQHFQTTTEIRFELYPDLTFVVPDMYIEKIEDAG